VILQEQEAVEYNINEEGEAILSALTLKVTPEGQLVVDRDTVDLHKVKTVCGDRFLDLYEMAVWVDNLFHITHLDINSSIGDAMEKKDESIRI